MIVLVTGHLGFIGQHLSRVLRERGDVVLGMDIREGAHRDVLRAELPDVDHVWHLAAQTNAQSENSWGDAQTNIMGTVRLLRKYGSRLTLASSAMVAQPSCPYAISKRAAEDYALYYGASVVRLPNVWGPGGHSAMDRFERSSVIEIRGTGEQRRTYAHVREAVEALLSAEQGETVVVSGETLTVNEVAARHPGKVRVSVPAARLDPMSVTQ